MNTRESPNPYVDWPLSKLVGRIVAREDRNTPLAHLIWLLQAALDHPHIGSLSADFRNAAESDLARLQGEQLFSLIHFRGFCQGVQMTQSLG